MLSARRARVFLLSPPSRLGSIVLFAIYNIYCAFSGSLFFVFFGTRKDNIVCRSVLFRIPENLITIGLCCFKLTGLGER